MRAVVLGALCVVVGSLGCEGAGATAAASRPAVVFPTRAELASIASVAPPAEAFGPEEAPVETWSFEAQASTETSGYDDPSPWGEVARDIAKKHPATVGLSAPLRCAAQELARFHAQNGVLPTESLRRFAAARCGALTTGLAPAFWSVSTPTPPPDEALAGKAEEALTKLFARRLDEGHHQLAVAAARDGKRTTVVALVALDEARLEGGDLTVDASRRVVLRGAVRREFASIGALINRGAVGTAPCQPDASVAPPRFALTCDLAGGDSFAWVELLGRRKDEVLLHEIGETIVHEPDTTAITYTARHVGPPAPVTTAQDFTRAVLDGLNRVRAGARMEPLALAPAQSAENTRLAGTLIQASLKGDDATANRVTIGLLAGWDVPGLIRGGAFYLEALRTSDSTAWIDSALERPIGRSALLDPAARIVAIGSAVPPGGGAVGGAITTYSRFESDDHSLEASKLFGRLVAARSSRGLPPPVRVQGLGEMDAELVRVAHQEEQPMAALQTSMEVAVARTGRGVHGYVFETSDLERTDIPPALLTPGSLRVMLGVTHHRADGAAWGQYVVLAVVLGE